MVYMLNLTLESIMLSSHNINIPSEFRPSINLNELLSYTQFKVVDFIHMFEIPVHTSTGVTYN